MGDEKDVFRVNNELGLRLGSLRKRVRLTRSELARKFVELALDGLDRQFRRK